MTAEKTKGIIVGCDSKQEYLLPFFYINLRLHSNLPITFFDFGMTALGQDFCKKRGNLLSIEDSLYESNGTEFKEYKRRSWFKKPLACQKAPYDKNLWIDLDILIRAPFNEVFDHLDEEKQIAIVHEFNIDVSHLNLDLSLIPIYNSGFFAFFKNSKIIDNWIDLSLKIQKSNIGDQDVLSFELYNIQNQVAALDPSYNCILASKEEDIAHLIDVEAQLFIHDPLNRGPKSFKEAKNLHFAHDTKALLLARFSQLEKLSLNKYSQNRFQNV